MKKFALLASLALVAIGISSVAQATQCGSVVALRCVWTFHGNYIVKDAESSNEYITLPSRGENCADALEILQVNDNMELQTSAGNALTDTHVLVQCGQVELPQG